MLANWITLSRYPLLLIFIVLIYSRNAAATLVSVPLLLIAILLDSVDGYIARSNKITSMMGSVLDIALDRTYELVLWIILLHLGMVPVAIPLIVVIRTVMTDALRSLGVSEGKRPFDQQEGSLGSFLVKSPWMRSSYGFSKILAFCGLTLAYAFSLMPEHSWAQQNAALFKDIFVVAAWIAAMLCVVRGLPVVVTYGKLLFSEKHD
ncbi:MAG: CDP-alcohol phosphatidyltransferase family protein [Anaerolineales bacterium]|nr:CDP-alcohol phosphatidyltransferase family protein [Anaerolineales bacterium]